MIQEVRKSIHFSPYVPTKGRPKDDDPAPTVSLDAQRGRLLFSGKTLERLNMVGRFVAFYYEPTRKIIGWRIREKLEEGQLYGKNEKWKLVKTVGKGKGFYVAGVRGILDEFKGLNPKGDYKKLEVMKYIETASVMDKGDVYYFIEVAEKKSHKDLI